MVSDIVCKQMVRGADKDMALSLNKPMISSALCSHRVVVMADADGDSLIRAQLPFFARGTVVHGFGRGSKELGVPTANFPDDVVENLPEQLSCGVYCGFATVNDDTVYPMVSGVELCIG